MPHLNTTLHLDMWEQYTDRNRFFARVRRAVRLVFSTRPLYGMEWGDPEAFAPLAFIRDHYLLPYVKSEQTALEIGPGGGRWTQYLLRFGQLYLVDYYSELLGELRRNFTGPNLTFIKNNGSDFPGVPDRTVDFVFSFGCFVHLDAPIIESYLENLPRILRPGANVVLHYSDKTKVLAQMNPAFSENTPERMRGMIEHAGFTVVEEELTAMSHSSIVRFTL